MALEAEPQGYKHFLNRIFATASEAEPQGSTLKFQQLQYKLPEACYF